MRSRSSKQYNYSEIDNEQVKKIRDICPVNQYRVVSPAQVKNLSLLPEELVDKYDSVLVASSGSATGEEVAYMLNGNRVDPQANAIDQMPFGFICSGSTPLTAGCLVQHGDWESRSTTPDKSFWGKVTASGIGTCYPLAEMPTEKSGSISELKIDSQRSAMSDLVTELRKSLREG